MAKKREELLREIKKLRKDIALEPFGSPHIDDLTVQLIMVYDEYVEFMENRRKEAA